MQFMLGIPPKTQYLRSSEVLELTLNNKAQKEQPQ